MKVLIACEESQVVCKEFRYKGHEAFSCDILECSGGHPEWHIKDDVLKHLTDGWDMMVAHPPCTYLTVTANKWLKEQPQRKSGKLVGFERKLAQLEAIDFFMKLYNAPIKKVVIENPIGIMSTIFMKPTQIVHPYYYGDAESKATCLWIRGLKPLTRSMLTFVSPKWIQTKNGKWFPNGTMYETCKTNDLLERSRLRSKTFTGIAKAMAEQWG